ncbi:MAG: polysaccharide deacetylase family protein [Chitinophagaceae bacterium]|nr:polysaccharide deacetylase family protein [Chitinophagaceae bacterium]
MIRKTIEKIYKRISRSSYYALDSFQGASGMHDKLYRSARGARILIYHGVTENDPNLFNSLFISRNRFEQQLRLFKKYFHTVSLDDYYLQRFDPDKFNICLSFDDGFANNHRHVLPLLEHYRIPAVFFITAIRQENLDILWNDFLTLATAEGPQELMLDGQRYIKHGRVYRHAHSGRSLPDMLRDSGAGSKRIMMQALQHYSGFREREQLQDYWLQLTPGQIREMAASPWVTIGSHGYFHNDLARTGQEDLTKELVDSKTFLETIIQKPVKALAFPYGSYSPPVITAALQAGYEQLLAAAFNNEQDNDEPAMRERMGINPYISAHNQMTAIIKGHYHD